jgi:hypothetical protein
VVIVDSQCSARQARCLDCDYALEAIESSLCPECGRAFDRAVPGSFAQAAPMPAHARLLIRPMGRKWIALAAAATLALSVLCSQTVLQAYLINICLPMSLFFLLGLIWLIRRTLHRTLCNTYDRRQFVPQEDARWRWIWSVWIALGASLLLSFPLRVNVWLSGSSLDEFAQQALRSGSRGASPLANSQWIGGFHFQPMPLSRITESGGVSLQLNGSSDGGSGIAYDPTGELRDVPHNNGFGHIVGDWYWWDED